MFIHSIVYIILSMLSATAVYASSTPVSKAPGERQLSETGKEADKEANDTL
ncbi:MAG: hypothetical protein V2I26_13440 [Halieaceae bacterium]|jgi:hypothetical protein|nr:hypothetical protein [Halieaceae bacterium]